MKSILIYFILITVFTFLCFGYDKQLARKNKRRISERNLFILVFLGGTIGGLVGMSVFRHKTNKTSFILIFYGILILQLVLLYFGFDFLKRFT
ncbi:DUF1294 domain-containing protein [Flavobacterium sp.]|uniref:DUF1294 domain-containing protein n=1 Tax=Flavobacterium sp. TaxID=239 RepID=UPI002A82B2D4|nr:DUF1294 domain-containing protein [Flavobacterium sp.]